MALAKSRLITVDGKTHQWQSLGWTPGYLTLTIRDEDGRITQFLANSKHWTEAHQEVFEDDCINTAPIHKVAFGPRQVREVIDRGLTDCDLTDWEVKKL